MTGLERACRKYGEITHHQNGRVFLLRWDDTREKMIKHEIFKTEIYGINNSRRSKKEVRI